MKKQVNLYQPSCYPKREKATFSQFLALFVICLLASLLSYFVMNHQSQSANERLLEHKKSISEQQLQLSSLVAELQKKRAPDAKLRLHSMLENEVKAKQRLLATLAGIDVKESVSFSELMRGLAYADMPNLTINHFSMISGTLNITGDAKYSDSLPLWLSNMQITDELSAMAFKALSIKEKKGFFTFQLTNSELKGKASE
ncbi:hypothetical protein [Psychromonas sp. Urea-02u-13]|uniref:hypothetical protein n=1 Tax=Psychromonas sp. Urea-02u-13 TaxID=2058326 RepID=UPI000C348B3B|nr:hypothetical protein [Psychromonas sp. Urea-02u-13]PKG39831.1 hypothetical protein CXF74_05750 [Psychromonas sp. Urea-02u-13]